LTTRSISTINKTLPITKLSLPRNGSPIQRLAVSPDQKYLLQGQHIVAKEGENFSGDILEIYNIEKKNPSLVLKQRTGASLAATFSPDSKYVVACANTGVARISLTDEKTQMVNLEEPKFLSPDGMLVACSSNDGWIIKSTLSSTEKTINIDLPKNVDRFLSFSPVKNVFATTLKQGNSSVLGTRIAIWVINEENKTVFQFEWDNPSYVTPEKSCFSPNGRYFACPSRQGYVGIWNISTGKRFKEIGEVDGVIRTVEFSPNSNLLAIGIQEANGKYGKLAIWDINNEKIVREIYDKQAKGITAVSFAPDNETFFIGNTSGDVRCESLKNKKSFF
jgi:WD40 repeat protein